MIRSKLPHVKLSREEATGQKITYDMIKDGAHVSSNVIARLMSHKPVIRIDGKTLSGLCSYFSCQVGEILEYVPNQAEPDEANTA
jgi:DNA-binding Xre family transcriptional regulator